jgi:signal transduction histidine kinase
MSISNRIVLQTTVALLAMGLLSLLVIVGMTVWLGERAQISFDNAIEARDTRAAAVELRNAMLAAESSQRGYLVTGNEIYLAPYGAAKSLALRQLELVGRALMPRAQTQALLQRLSAVVADKFKEMDETIELKGDRKEEEALAVFRTNRGKALMDEANVFLSGIIRAADARLTTEVGEQRRNAHWLRWASILGGLLIVAVVGGAAVTVVRYTHEVVQARDEVRDLNAGLEERVAARTSELARANEEVQRFAYIVTHDLRAPLVNIMGFTSELEGSVKSLQALIDKLQANIDPADPVAERARLAASEEVPEALEFIRSSTKKMDDLIHAILRLSREGSRQLRPERLDLVELVRASAGAIQHQISAAGGTVELKLDVCSILTDRLALEQIIGNLLDNAVKFRSSKRPLKIEVRTTYAARGRVSLEITDNGRGIAERDLERVFELFRRAGQLDQPGEGIGLAHVRTLARNLGGDVTVRSVLDEGTTFLVMLPTDLQANGSRKA